MSRIITDKEQLQEFTSPNRLWEGIPGIEVTKKGRLFCCFFSGAISETIGNYSLLIKSDDAGNTWSEPILAAFLEGPIRCFDPCVWIAPDGKLWFFWAVRYMEREGKPLETYATFTEDPDADEIKWCEPFAVGPGVMLNKPLVCADGDVIFSISSWAHTSDKVIDVYRSNDNGITRAKIGSVQYDRLVFGEQIIVERKDTTLAMYIRTDYGIGVSLSYDGGYTWTKAAKTSLGGPCSRFFIGRLQSGKLLLVNHHDYNKRDNLKAMLSDDDGETWYGYIMLDERDNVSYPDAVQASDGTIYIIYDRNRGGGLKSLEQVLSVEREILLARLTEQDIENGKLTDEQSYVKRIVHKLGEYSGKDKNPYKNVELYTDEEYTAQLVSLGNGVAAVEQLMTDYSYHCANVSAELFEYIDKLFGQLESGDYDDDPIQRTYIIGRLVHVLRGIAIGDDSIPPYEIVKRIFAYINDNITTDCSLDEIASHLHISKYYMCYLFKLETNTTIIRYKNYRRIAIAKQLLLNTELSVTEISERTGFGDTSYFTKWFRQIEGITPTSFRSKKN